MDVAGFMEKNGLTELAPGAYEMELTVRLPEGLRLEKPATVPVLIQQSETETENNEEE